MSIRSFMHSSEKGMSETRHFVRTVVINLAKVLEKNPGIDQDEAWEIAIEETFIKTKCPDCCYSPTTGHVG
jgi:hypothetical protein